MSAGEEQAALVWVQSAALTKAGANSLAARGHADLWTKEQAERWLGKGFEFSDQRKYEDAFHCFERGIQLDPNHVGLQIMLGMAHHYGQGVPQDHTQAAFWYLKAALDR